MPRDPDTLKPYRRKLTAEEVYRYRLRVSKGKGKQRAQDQEEDLPGEVHLTPSPTAGLSALGELSIHNGSGGEAILDGYVAEQAPVENDSPRTLASESHVPTSYIALASAAPDLAPTPAATAAVPAPSPSPAPAPITPAPAPTLIAPAPAPTLIAPAPAPTLIASAPAHAPIASTPAHAPTTSALAPAPATITATAASTQAPVPTSAAGSSQQIDTRVDELERTIHQLNTRFGEFETLAGRRETMNRFLLTSFMGLEEDDEMGDNLW